VTDSTESTGMPALQLPRFSLPDGFWGSWGGAGGRAGEAPTQGEPALPPPQQEP
jgi:hypothetical protein